LGVGVGVGAGLGLVHPERNRTKIAKIIPIFFILSPKGSFLHHNTGIGSSQDLTKLTKRMLRATIECEMAFNRCRPTVDA